jgi:predicted PhzF superfamily epimerase YddE/YHI9
MLADAARVLSLEPESRRFGQFPDIGVVGPYPVGSDVAFEVRAFTAGDAVTEDPVTGSLNASLAQWLINGGRAPRTCVASQGTRLGRRGWVHIAQEDGQIRVGGDTVIGVIGSVNLDLERA